MADLNDSIDQIEPSLSPSAIPASKSNDERLAALYPEDAPKSEAAEPAEKSPVKADDAKPDVNADQVPAGDYQLTMPENTEADPVLLKEAAPVFRELGLTNATASKLMPLANRVIERFQDRQEEDFDALKTDWAKQVKSDPDLGGAKWSQTERLMGVALEAAGANADPAFRKLMDQSGLGNHPAFVRAFKKLGERLAGLKAGKGQPQTRRQVLYPDD